MGDCVGSIRSSGDEPDKPIGHRSDRGEGVRFWRGKLAESCKYLPLSHPFIRSQRGYLNPVDYSDWFCADIVLGHGGYVGLLKMTNLHECA